MFKDNESKNTMIITHLRRRPLNHETIYLILVPIWIIPLFFLSGVDYLTYIHQNFNTITYPIQKTSLGLPLQFLEETKNITGTMSWFPQSKSRHQINQMLYTHDDLNNNNNNTDKSDVSDANRFISFWLQSLVTQGERYNS